MIKVVKATQVAEHVCTATQLIKEYAAELNVDLTFQNVEGELENPLRKYSAPGGIFLIAYINDEPAGCVGYQFLQPGTCEMKRLYTRPLFRGRGIGQVLVENLIDVASQCGYKWMMLDTLATLKPAITLYTKFGFEPTNAYYNNPLPGVIYMKKGL